MDVIAPVCEGMARLMILYVSMDTINSKVHACAVTHQLHKFNCSITEKVL